MDTYGERAGGSIVPLARREEAVVEVLGLRVLLVVVEVVESDLEHQLDEDAHFVNLLVEVLGRHGIEHGRGTVLQGRGLGGG
jgi:hypothetical protein